MASLKCIVVTPEKTVLDQPAEFVAVPLYDGELGIAPGHTPLVGRLGWGELRLRSGLQVWRDYVEGGFVEVAGDVVSILTPRAVAAQEIDALVAEHALSDAARQASYGPESIEARDKVMAQARAAAHCSASNPVATSADVYNERDPRINP